MGNTFSPSNDVSVHCLASGSSGNSMLIQCGSTNILIDAGLSLRTISPQFSKHGVNISGLSAILITHEHSDHTSGLGPIARKSRAPVVSNTATLQACAARDELSYDCEELSTGETREIGCFTVRSFSVSHDAVEPVGWILESGNTKIVYATDTGYCSVELQSALSKADLIILEANHDLDWLQRGPYTHEMKARVASETGHLSNKACADAVSKRLEEDGPSTIWLAHLSRVNNSPSLARRSVQAGIRANTKVPFALDVALRDHPSVFWQAGRQAVQLSLM